MKQFLKTNIKAVITLSAVLAAGLILLFMRGPGPGKVSMAAEEKVISIRAVSGDVSSLFVGSGTLTDDEYESVKLPDTVEIVSYAVMPGDRVRKGDKIARVDKVSVRKAISGLQDAIDELDLKLAEAADNTVSSGSYAKSYGRVKEVYAEAGDRVEDVMFEHGSLILLSLDGCMACDLPANGNQSVGDRALVVRSDGTELPARVAKLDNGIMTVICSDVGTKLGEAVTVTDESGITLGKAELYVHVPRYVTAFSGTVDGVYVTEESPVSLGQTLIHYSDTGYTGEYDRLLALRTEYEDTMRVLFDAENDGYIRAPADGLVTELDDSVDYVPVSVSFSAAKSVWSGSCGGQYVLLSFANEPSPGEEPAPQEPYTKAAIVYAVGKDSLSLLVTADPVPDGTAPASLDTALFTDIQSISADPSAGRVKAGDYILLSYSAAGEMTGWTVISSGGADTPGGGRTPGGFAGGFSGGGMTGGLTGTGEEESSYVLSKKVVFSVIPPEKMTVTVSVDELDILSLTEGEAALVTLDAFPGRSFEGIVTDIDPTGTNSGGTTKYSATVTIDRSDNMLAGMNASVRITLSKKADVLLIPLAAISEEKGKSIVYTGYDERKDVLTDPKEISTGLSDGENVEVLSGLEVGDPVFYRYADSLKIEIA